MTIKQGSFGRVRVFEDFLSKYEGSTAFTTTFTSLGQLGLISVSAGDGATVTTVNEPGGVVSLTTHTDDDDNVALHCGMFKPADGGCVMEARFKNDSITEGAIFCGFMEALAVTTPVMAIEYDTATQATNSCAVGMLFDPDGTDPDIWRAVAGDATTDATGSPISATTSLVADEWDVVRVEITADKGDGYCYLNGALIKKFSAFCTTTDVFHAVLMIENRTGAANVLEVDYFYAEGGRDWADD